MRRQRTAASRWAAGACLAIGVLYASRLLSATSTVSLLLESVMVVIAVATAVKMWAHNCFESHLAAGALVAATAGSTLLAVTLGLPGEDAGELTVVRTVLLVLSVVIVLLLVQDGRVRREQARRRRRPYGG